MFLNPYVEHGHELRIALLVDGSTEAWSVDGQGVGWSAARRRGTRDDLRNRVVALAMMASFFGTALAARLGAFPDAHQWLCVPIGLLPTLVAGVWAMRSRRMDHVGSLISPAASQPVPVSLVYAADDVSLDATIANARDS